MKKLVLIVLLGVFISVANSQIFGVGLKVGDPTVVFSAKYWLTRERGWDFGGSFERIAGKMCPHFHFTYLAHIYGFIPDPHFSFYGGIGGRVEARGHPEKGGFRDWAVGVRFALGIFDFFYSPVEIFLEGAPTIDIYSPDRIPDIDVEFGLGARYFFGRR